MGCLQEKGGAEVLGAGEQGSPWPGLRKSQTGQGRDGKGSLWEQGCPLWLTESGAISPLLLLSGSTGLS